MCAYTHPRTHAHARMHAPTHTEGWFIVFKVLAVVDYTENESMETEHNSIIENNFYVISVL